MFLCFVNNVVHEKIKNNIDRSVYIEKTKCKQINKFEAEKKNCLYR